MKYFYITLLALLPVCSLQAQDVIDKVSDGTCSCLEKAKVAEKESSKLEIELGMCLLEQISPNKAALERAGYDTKAKDFYEKIGEAVGVRLAVSCPYFMNMIVKIMSDEDSDLKKKVEEKITEDLVVSKEATITIVNGVVQTVEYGDFIKISIKDSEGKRKDFYWINSFEGDDKVIALTSPDLLVGKAISVGYMEEDVYFYKMKSYLGINKIKSLDIK